MFGNLGFPEMLLIFLVVLLLFGAKKLPEIAQGLGKGIREFKKAMKETSDEVKGSVSGELPPPKREEPPKRDDSTPTH
jgi:sec-independent protein translocase protein TatA